MNTNSNKTTNSNINNNFSYFHSIPPEFSAKWHILIGLKYIRTYFCDMLFVLNSITHHIISNNKRNRKMKCAQEFYPNLTTMLYIHPICNNLIFSLTSLMLVLVIILQPTFFYFYPQSRVTLMFILPKTLPPLQT